MRDKKYLIVDDDPAIRGFVERCLKAAGVLRLCIGTTGSEALQLAENEQPDLIILDVRMPGLNGLSALRQLREGPSTAHIPVVVMTGEVDFHTVRLGQHASALLQKPFTQRELLAQISRILESCPVQHQAELSAAAP